MRLLLCEDDFNLGENLLKVLQKEMFNVNLVSDGEAAQTFIESGLYDIIILNISLPIRTGLEVLKNVRNRDIKTPIIFLLKFSDSIENKIKCLNLGADDCLTKPFEFKELVARIKALFRRSYLKSSKIKNEDIRFGSYIFNPSLDTGTKNGRIILVSKKELLLLSILVQSAGRVVSKKQLLEEVYFTDKERDTNTLEVHVHNLRKKISIPNFIETIRGVGYFVQKDKVKK